MDEKAFFKLPFTQWCTEATNLIKFGPDRDAVSAELYAHLTDHFDALVEQGVPEEEARAQALEAMGSAKEIAPQLAAIHAPFWGYVLRISRIAMIILLCLCVLPVWNYLSDLRFGVRNYRDFALFDAASYGGESGRELHYLSSPGTSFQTDGNTFTLTDAVIFTETTADGTEKTRFYFRLAQTSLLPWSEQEDYFGLYSNRANIGSTIYVVDSLGNTYSSYQEGYPDNESVVPNGGQTGIFTYTHECWINDFQGVDAKWVAICYTRDGRDYSVMIDLTGGGRR